MPRMPFGPHDLLRESAPKPTPKAKLTFTSRPLEKFSGLGIDFFERPNCCVYAGQGKIYAIASSKHEVFAIDVFSVKIELFPVPTNDPVCLTASGEFLGVAGRDAVLHVFRGDSTRPWISMPTYRDSIACACVNVTFLVAVIGTRDGSLIINSLNKGATVRVLDLKGGRPLMLCVTPVWGFIVAYVAKVKNAKLWHWLFVFNVNGRRIRKVRLDFAIANWCCWASRKGFDYMVISDARGKLFSFEVFYCKIGDSFIRCNSPLATLLYIGELEAIVAVTQNGRIMFVPHVIDEEGAELARSMDG
jgi:hypothetical protein